MRPSQKSSSRSRGKSGSSRKGSGNVANRVYESAGPEGKVRGTPQQVIDKYQALARDAQTSGDRVVAENFLQHAEHYVRLLSAAQQQMEERRAQHGGGQQRDRDDDRADDEDEERLETRGDDRQPREHQPDREDRRSRDDHKGRDDREARDDRPVREREPEASRSDEGDEREGMDEVSGGGLAMIDPADDDGGLVSTPEDGAPQRPSRRNGDGRPPRRAQAQVQAEDENDEAAAS